MNEDFLERLLKTLDPEKDKALIQHIKEQQAIRQEAQARLQQFQKQLKARAAVAREAKRHRVKVVLDVDGIDYSRLKRFVSDAVPTGKWLVEAAFGGLQFVEFFSSKQAAEMLVQGASDYSDEILQALNQALLESKVGIRCSAIDFQRKGDKMRVALDIIGVLETLNQKASEAGIHISDITFQQIK